MLQVHPLGWFEVSPLLCLIWGSLRLGQLEVSIPVASTEITEDSGTLAAT